MFSFIIFKIIIASISVEININKYCAPFIVLYQMQQIYQQTNIDIKKFILLLHYDKAFFHTASLFFFSLILETSLCLCGIMKVCQSTISYNINRINAALALNWSVQPQYLCHRKRGFRHHAERTVGNFLLGRW